MTLSSDEESVHSKRARSRAGDGSADGDWAEAPKPNRDWKKLTLVIGLGLLSWVATYVGMLELIEANMGELPLVHKVIIGFSVGMLMTMIVWLLDQLFAPIGLFTKVLYAAGYVFLTIISVGFGFGFYWKVLESRSEASRSAESAVAQVQGSLQAASTRLEQLQSTLVQLTAVSTQKAEIERTSGTSCPNSRPGDGPRRKLREDDAARFTFASDFVKGRVGAVKADMSGLELEFARISNDDKSTVDARSGTRNEFMKALSRKLDMTVTGFNAFRTDPQLKQIRADLAERAEKVSFIDTKGGTYSCPDPQLQTALRGAVRAIEQLPELEKPKIAAVEGSEATIEAFRRLTATFYGMASFKLPPSADELRALQQKAVQSVEISAAQARMAAMGEQAGLSKRDYVPLAIAIFVDICLLLVSMGRPVNRLNGLVPKMREAERGPVYQILSKFSDIHKDRETREKFEIFRHVVFDFNGDYYVAVPLNAPVKCNPEQRLDLQLEAHLLANLFSSFEKERIFSRVHSPFLTTRTIQRKLWRQGSKFAGSEAFRIYRFRDGAWSEIILGAIMGAARRVEGQKRQRQAEEGPRLPSFDTGSRFEDQIHAAPGPAAGKPHFAQAEGRPQAGTPHREPLGDYGRSSYRTGVGDGSGRQQPTAPGYGQAPAQNRAMNGARRPASAPSLVDNDPATLVRRFGPYAHTVAASVADSRATSGRPAPSASYREMAAALSAVGSAREKVAEAEVSVRAANNNTAPPDETQHHTAGAGFEHEPLPAATSVPAGKPIEPALLADNVVQMPRVVVNPRNGEDTNLSSVQNASETVLAGSSLSGMIDVTVRRETATFSVPVSEARLPQSLANLMGQAIVTGQAVRKTEVEVAADPIITTLQQNMVPAPRGGDTGAPGSALVIVQSPLAGDGTDETIVEGETGLPRRLAGTPAE